MKTMTIFSLKVLGVFFILLCFYVSPLDTSSSENRLTGYKRSIELLKIGLHTTLENSRIQRTRSILGHDDRRNQDRLKLSTNQVEIKDAPFIHIWSLVEVNDTEVVFAVTNDGYISIYNNSKFVRLHEFSSDGPIYSMLAFQHGNGLWLIALHLSKSSNYFLQVFEYESDHLNSKQILKLEGFSYISISVLQRTNYLVLLTNREFNSDVTMFALTGTQLDELDELKVSLKHRSSGLVSWEKDKVLYIAVNLLDKNQLVIYRFAKYQDNFIRVQVIESKFHECKYLTYRNSEYLVCGAGIKITLFWWSGLEFLKQQELVTQSPDSLLDISVFVSTQYGAVIIAVKKNQLEYFAQVSSSTFLSSGTLKLDNSLKNICIWKNNDKFYILPVFEEFSTRIIFELNFNLFALLKESYEEGKCIDHLYETVQKNEHDILELQSKLRTLWRKDTMAAIPSLHVLGFVKSNGIANVSSASFHESLNAPPLALVKSISEEITEKTSLLNNSIQAAVLKSNDQNISGPVSFQSDLKALEVNIGHLSLHSVINEILTSRLLKVLKANGDQSADFAYVFQNGKVDFIDTYLLNGIDIKDLQLLNNHTTISGNLVFKDVFASSIIVENKTINGLALTDIVTTFSPQYIKDEKIFPLLVTESLVSNGHIAGVNISTLDKMIDSTTSQFDTKLNFISVVTANNITLHTINGHNILYDLEKSVTTSGDQTISGPKTFLSLSADELSVEGKINDLNLEYLMTLHTSQNISSDLVFNSASFKKIKTHVVNGIDLCSAAVLKNGSFKVEGQIFFSVPVKASSIDMEDYASINSLDISVYKELSKVFYLNEDLELDLIVVQENVYVEDMAFNVLLENLRNNVLSKTKNQNISDAKFKFLSTKNLFVEAVNDFSFGDIALKDGNVSLNSSKTFENVSILTLEIDDWITLNDFLLDLDLIEALEEVSVIHAEEFFVKGNINVNAINDVQIFDFIHIQKMQNCSGINIFNGTKLQDLHTVQLNFIKYNGIEFDQYTDAATILMDNIRLPNYTYKITNTNFTELHGASLGSLGFLNGRFFEEMAQSIITLNSKQQLSNSVFLSEMILKGILICKSGLPNLTQVVSKKNPQLVITKKIFMGKVIVMRMNSTRILAGVDIEKLDKFAFYKSKRRMLFHPVLFLSGINSTSVNLSSASQLDKTYMNNVIETDKNFSMENISFLNINLKSINISGKVNNCYLWDLLVPGNSTNVIADKKFNRLIVDGNLTVNSSINKIFSKELTKTLTRFENTDSIENNISFSNINVMNLNVSNVSNIDVHFLSDDAVRFKKIEVIKGHKVFEAELISRNAKIESLKVFYLCEVNLPDVYTNYITKQSDQKLSVKDLSQFKAKNVTVNRGLNGTKMPDDVILVSSDDFIPSIIINDVAILESSLNILGNVNNINLKDFVNNRVTLQSSEKIKTSFSFLKDVKLKEFRVKGLVNGISISEVVNIKDQYNTTNIIQGSKQFQEKLSVKSSLFGSQVNNVSLDALKWICEKERNENISQTVQFSEIEVTDIDVELINDISIREFSNDINSTLTVLNSVESFFRSNNSYVKELLLQIKDETKDIFPSFGFFELQQELHIGPTEQFLPIHSPGISGDSYELPTLKMIVWGNQNKSCETFKSIQMVAEPNGILDQSQTFLGRIFPFPLSNPHEVESFLLHTYKNENCTSTNSLKTILKDGIFMDYTLENPLSEVLQAQLLELENGTFLLVSYSFEGRGERIYLYEYNTEENVWKLGNSFHSWEISYFDVLFIIDSPIAIHLVVSNGEIEPGIYLYKWDFQNKQFIAEIAYSLMTTAVKWISDDEDNVFLLVAKKSKIKNGSKWVDVYSEPIDVYLHEDDSLHLNHTINLKGISSFETFHFEGELYVLAVSSYFHTVYVLQHRGSNGFEKIQEIKAPGVKKVTLFTSQKEDLLLGVSSVTKNSKILKFIAKGNTDDITDSFKLYSD